MRHSSPLFFEGVSSKFLIGEGSGFWDLLLRLAPIEQLCSLWQISAACLFLMTDQQMEIVTWEKIISTRASAKNGNSTLGKSFAFQPMQLKFFPGEEFCHDLKVCVIAFPIKSFDICPWQLDNLPWEGILLRYCKFCLGQSLLHASSCG